MIQQEMTGRFQSAGKSDPGRVRSRNEDSFVIDEEHGLFLVADGMGGHAGGATASDIAVSTVHSMVKDFPDSDNDDTHQRRLEWLAGSIRKAGEKIYGVGNEEIELRGMGTTTTAIWIPPGISNHAVFLAHVGDSRAYRLRESQLSQITRDHSWVMEQVRAGHLSLSEARTHRLRSLITRSVGFQSDVAVDTEIVDLKAGDAFLLCSDGLSNHVNDSEIQSVLETHDPEKAVETLVEQANARGGQDNITVIVLKFLG